MQLYIPKSPESIEYLSQKYQIVTRDSKINNNLFPFDQYLIKNQHILIDDNYHATWLLSNDKLFLSDINAGKSIKDILTLMNLFSLNGFPVNLNLG
jgi:hypothetical protein